MVDASAFERCRLEKSPDQEINADMALARHLGITVTPTLIMNGAELRTGVSVQDLENVYGRRL